MNKTLSRAVALLILAGASLSLAGCAVYEAPPPRYQVYQAYPVAPYYYAPAPAWGHGEGGRGEWGYRH